MRRDHRVALPRAHDEDPAPLVADGLFLALLTGSLAALGGTIDVLVAGANCRPAAETAAKLKGVAKEIGRAHV